MPSVLRVKREDSPPPPEASPPPNPKTVSDRFEKDIAEAQASGDKKALGRLMDKRLAAFQKAVVVRDAYWKRMEVSPEPEPEASGYSLGGSGPSQSPPPLEDPDAPDPPPLEDPDAPEFALVDRPRSPRPAP